MRVDHLVWYCADLAEGERYFAERMDLARPMAGFIPAKARAIACSRCPIQPMWKSSAAIPPSPKPVSPPKCAGSKGYGLYHWAIGGVDLAGLRQKASAAGLAGSDLVTGGRKSARRQLAGLDLFWHSWPSLWRACAFLHRLEGSAHPARPRRAAAALRPLPCPRPRRKNCAKSTASSASTFPSRSAPPGLSVTLESARAAMCCRMFNPVPRGYVI